MKKYYISVDCEGMACVAGANGQGVKADTKDYPFACAQATREASAAARALFDCGADEVVVWDSHGTGVNLDYAAFDKRCRFAIGAGSRKRFPLIDGTFDGVLFIGYHAYGVPDAVLAHVMSSVAYHHMKINGRQVGEVDLDAAIAGKHGVPPIFVSGDDVFIGQAKESFGDIAAVETKKALAWNNCLSKHPLAAAEEIYETVKKAAQSKITVKPYFVEPPFEYEIRFTRIEYAQGSTLRDINNKMFSRPDAYTRRGTLADIEHVFEF